MGIFDRFLGKKKKEEEPVVAPVAPVEPVKKPGRKKKDPVRITEGIPKKGGLVNPSDKSIVDRPKAPPGQTAKKKTSTKKKNAKKSDYQNNLEKAKAEATKKGEPWVSVLSVELDMDNLSNGSFNLDWNEFFLAKLVRAGYKGTDEEMVDQWFQSICRNILQENFEQEQADPTNRFRE